MLAVSANRCSFESTAPVSSTRGLGANLRTGARRATEPHQESGRPHEAMAGVARANSPVGRANIHGGFSVGWPPRGDRRPAPLAGFAISVRRVSVSATIGRSFLAHMLLECVAVCAATTCAIATSADSRAHPVGSSLRASWRWLPQTNAECRVPTVRPPSPMRRVVQPALLRRRSAAQMTGGATLQLCR